jgi:transposase InsO family protein
MSTSQKISVTLNGPSDWDEWIEVVKTLALAGKVWDYIDPSKDEVPALEEPLPPQPSDVNDQVATFGLLSQEEREEFRILRQDYKWQRDLYDRRDNALASLRTSIQSSVSRTYLHYTFGTSSARDMIIELQKRLQPTDQLRELDLSAKYEKLRRAPKAQDLDHWLRSWEKVYHECAKIDLPEVQGVRAVRDFLRAVSTIIPEFSTYWVNDIAKTGGQDGPDLYRMVELFRDHRRHLAIEKGHVSRSAFTTTFQEGNRMKKDCLCGEPHRFKECPYLVEGKRPAGWKADRDTQDRINSKLQKPSIKAAVDRARAEAKKEQAEAKRDASTTSTDEDDSIEDGAFAISTFTAIPRQEGVYALHDSFILDSASTIHVCNNRERFQSLRPATENDHLIAGASRVPIEGFGLIEITLKRTPTSTRKIKLAEVALVPSFHTNIVSMDRLMQRNVHWNTERQELRYKSDVFGIVEKKHGQWVLEYSPIETASFAARSAQPQPDSSATAGQWHQRLGHVGPDVLEHLSAPVTGVKLTDGPSTIQCEACSTGKMHKVVSRRATPRATTPFERVHFDLIQMTEGFNGDKWILHFLDDATRMNFIYTLSRKSLLTDTILYFTAYIRRRFNYEVKILHTDNERALGETFKTWIKDNGYTVEYSAPYTPGQNGAAERSGGLIISKARLIRINANLPENLWPEIIAAAGYLLNRTPTKQLDWKSPIQVLQDHRGVANPKPNIAHLRVYGCRAYPLIRKIPKKQKLRPRAQIGYLVGYDSSNIFRIWVPQDKKIIVTRDVTFDESRKYDPGDLRPALQERVQEPRETIEFPNLELARGVETENEESDEESDAQSDSSIDSDQSSTIEVIRRDDTAPKTQQAQAQRGLPTPEDTPTPTQPEEILAPSQALSQAPSRPRPRHEIIGGVGEPNIAEGTRTRQPTKRYENYLTDLARPDELPAYHSAFAIGTKAGHPRVHQDDLPSPPRTWKELQSHRYGPEFKEAARTEYQTLEGRETFQVVPKTPDIKVIPLTWVFTYKLDTDGYLTKFKARICVRGDLQPRSNKDTYAATLAARIFRTLMAMTAAYDLETHHLDAVNAFVNSQLDETVFCKFPDGFEQPDSCLLLLRALYGLRRSPLLWLQELSTTLKELGLKEVAGEPCLFINDDGVLVFFYVDDIVLLCRSGALPQLHKLRQALMQRYEMRNLGELSWFLGIRVIRDRGQRKLWLCQDSYIRKIATTFHLTDRKPPATPLAIEELTPNTGRATAQEIYLYQRKIGSLVYATTITRADAARAANKLSEFLTNPSPRHQDAADRAISYLNGTHSLAIEFSASDAPHKFTCASDSAFADDPVTRHSTEGCLFQLFGGPIDWRSTKQRTVTTSSTEAELLALSHAAKEVLWWKRLFEAIQFNPGHEIAIKCDNKQTIRLVTAQVPHLVTKLKHIDIQHHWLRQEASKKTIQIEWVPTAEMPADGLTKALPRQKHEIFIKQLGLVDIAKLL